MFISLNRKFDPIAAEILPDIEKDEAEDDDDDEDEFEWDDVNEEVKWLRMGNVCWFERIIVDEDEDIGEKAIDIEFWIIKLEDVGLEENRKLVAVPVNDLTNEDAAAERLCCVMVSNSFIIRMDGCLKFG